MKNVKDSCDCPEITFKNLLIDYATRFIQSIKAFNKLIKGYLIEEEISYKCKLVIKLKILVQIKSSFFEIIF